MFDPTNPYASPQTSSMNPVAAEWLGIRSPSLMRVATGLRMVYLSVVIILGTVVFGAIAGGIIGATTRSPQNVHAAVSHNHLLVFGTAAAGLGGRVLGLVGCLFCLATPSETKAQGYISASVATLIAATAIQVGALFGVIPPMVQPASLALMAFSAWMFVTFLRRMSDFVGRADLAKRAGSVLGWLLATIMLLGSLIGLGILRAEIAGRLQPFDISGLQTTLALALFIIGFIAVVKFASLVRRLRLVILAGNPEPI